jgi:long-subunit fatty acid transport protein
MKPICCWKFAELFCIFFLVLFFHGMFFTSAYGQELQRIEASSWNPVGSGARALGMGGAFIAVADDATAASWNPGGLIQLESPEVSIVGAYFYRNEDNYFGKSPESNGQQDFDFAGINYLSAAYPFNWGGRNMIFALNYQNLYDFTRHWKFSQQQISGTVDIWQDTDYKAEGSLGAIGLAYSIQVSPAFSLGLTLNFWSDSLYDNSWEQRRNISGTGSSLAGPVTSIESSIDKYSFSGINANIGFLWNATGRLTIGGVFKAPFRADLEHQSTSYTYLQIGAAAPAITNDHYVEDLKVDMPMSYGLGIAYRFSDSFTMSLDVYRTEWDDFALYTPDGEKRSPVTWELLATADIQPTTQVHTGAEYLFIRDKYVIPFRAGVFIDPAPAKGSPDYYYGLSVGTGLAYGRFIFDVAYQYRFANDANEFIMETLDFSQDIREHTVYASTIIHF